MAGRRPSLTPRLLIALFVAWWLTFGLMFGVRDRVWATWRGSEELVWAEAIRLGLFQAFTMSVLAAVALWVAHRFPLERHSWARNLLLHAAVGLVVILANGLLMHLLVPLITDIPRQPLLMRYVGVFPAWCLIYTLVLGVGYGLQYFRRYQERMLLASQLETQLAQAQLQALNMQLHPHFLFNTLNSISALMHRDVHAADRMLARLEDLLRLTLSKSGAQEVPLRDELEILEPYLEIEQTRFGDRLAVEWAVEPDTLSLAVPQLILQPLVENAIKHGISPRSAAGRIRLAAQVTGGMLELEVTDNGSGLFPERNGRSGSGGGVGLSNTRARLRRLYGDRHRFEIINVPTVGTCVRIHIPAHILEGGQAPPKRVKEDGAARRLRGVLFGDSRPAAALPAGAPFDRNTGVPGTSAPPHWKGS
jgi:two-component system, LytTR family, sensor kinase